jgi:type VII secretion integral membrane protein EccD
MEGGLSKVTIVSPRGRIDVALPSDTPLVDMLPTLLDASGGAMTEAGRRDGWGLSRLGGSELDGSRTPEQLAVRDGELLYLRPRGDAAPLTVFDDIIDALASGNLDRRGRWTAATTRQASLVTGMVLLLLGAASLPFAGPPYPTVAVAGLALAATLLVVATVFARALGDGRTATAFALVATGYAGVGGLLLLVGDAPLTPVSVAYVSVAATTTVVAATIASVSVPAAAPVFLGAGAIAAATFASIALATATGRGIAAAAAVTAVVAYAFVPAMPMLAFRMSGLKRPPIPTERESLRVETEPVDASRVINLGRRVDAYLTAMLCALAIVSSAAAVLNAAAGGRGTVFALVLALLPLLRGRTYGGRSHRMPLVLAGGVAVAAVAIAGFLALDLELRVLSILGASVVVAAGAVGIGLIGRREQSSPPWNRFLDIVEIVLILALIPLAAWVSGVLEWARAIRG